jgi:hypothetical protein
VKKIVEKKKVYVVIHEPAWKYSKAVVGGRGW